MNNILNEKNLKRKKILLRLDLNVPLKNGKISDTTRIDKILPTLNFLIQQKTKIIILSHVGRPKGKAVKELSLKPIGEYLRKKLNLKSSKKIVGIFPGSRVQELEVHLPIYLKAAESLSKQKNVKCVIGLAPGFDKLKIESQFNLGNIKIVENAMRRINNFW